MDKLLRVHMGAKTVAVEPLPEAYRHLGGRALTSRILLDEVDPTCEPLGPRNKLIFAPGLLAGTTVSSSNRLSVGCKSPLTGGIKEANSGGQTALLLAQRGYRAIIVEGQAPPGDWSMLIIHPDGRAELAPAGYLVGLGNYEAAARLQESFGRKAAIALIGVAGEMRLNLAGVATTDPEGRPSRFAARGGVGAVMGAKGLKALVVLPDGWQAVAPADPEGWKTSMQAYHRALREHPSTAKRFPELGTASTLEVVNSFGGLPTRNFSSGRFELVDRISGAYMRELILQRGGAGTPTHACMTGCAIRCSNVFPDPEGREVVSPMEFETNALMGSNLGIGDFDAIARFTRLCNDIGIDTIETGGALGVYMAAGLAEFGDEEQIVTLLEEIRRGSVTGRLLGAGAATVGKVLGVTRVPVVKGQTMAAYDPRVIKGNGVTYATSPMGADHTAGNTIAAKVDHLDPRGKVALSRQVQIASTILDFLGLCNFSRGPMEMNPEAFLGLFNARTGQNWNLAQLEQLARNVIQWEIEFNRRAGFTPAHDRIPEWMRETRLPPHDAVWDIPDEELDAIWA